jgi:flagellar hook-associated protein 2
MGASVGVGGIVSGVQWRELVDALVAQDRARMVTPLQERVSLATKRKTAWTEFDGLVRKLQDAAKALQTGSAFKAYSASVSPTASGRTLFTATAGETAVPGAYRAEVLSLARAEKLSGNVVADPSVALGLAGTFQVNGQQVSVAVGDSLNDVRDKIGAVNSGASATGVSASVLTSSTGRNRLVLSADAAGSTGVPLTDGPEGVLKSLGFLDMQSRTVSSATQAVAATLGVSVPAPSTIKIGGQTIAVDLTIDSLTSIAAKIRAASGQADVVAETNGGATTYRLRVGANVTASADPNSADTLTALGIMEGGRTAVRQVLASSASYTGAGGGVATGSTLLTDVGLGGVSAGLSAGSAINIAGVRGDGTSVSIGFTVQAGDTMDTLLARINDPVTGFGGGSRPASASIGPDGKLRFEDGTGGDSRLALSIGVVSSSGGASTAALGSFATETVGRSRELVDGSDAQMRIDGVLITRNSNTIGDALSGVSINLQQAEAGTVVDLTVSRDTSASMQKTKDFVKAYNDVLSFFNGQQLNGQPLANETTLRRVLSSFTEALRTEVVGAGSYSRGTLVGMTLDRNGRLELNESTFSTAMATNLSAVQSLFGSGGIGAAMVTATTVATRSGDGTIVSQQDSLDATSGRLSRRITVMEQRVQERREALIARFSSMEQALSRLQSQGNALSASILGLNK